MKKIKVYIDYLIANPNRFHTLSAPQVLYNYLKTQDDIELVGKWGEMDIILAFSGGSHSYASLWQRLAKRISGYHPANEFRQYTRKIDYNRRIKRNLLYEKRVKWLLRRNSTAKLVHRLDDRYRRLCKSYGYDDTVRIINSYASATIWQTEYCKKLYTEPIKTIFGTEYPFEIRNGIIINNGVDTNVFSEVGPRHNWEGKYKVLHVAATGMVRKGLGIVLEFAHLLKNNPDIQFYLVGRQPEDPVYGKDIRKFQNIKYMGYTNDRNELAKYYRSADILLFPSHNDCSPNVVLEAMSCGLPVVGANSGGIPELIQKQDICGGLLLGENPIYSLNEVINNLQYFRINCVKLIKQYHSERVIGEQYKKLFYSLLKEKFL